MSKALILKPVANVVIVAGCIIGLHDQIPEAGVRSAIGWCAASAIVETVSTLLAKRKENKKLTVQ